MPIVTFWALVRMPVCFCFFECLNTKTLKASFAYTFQRKLDVCTSSTHPKPNMSPRGWVPLNHSFPNITTNTILMAIYMYMCVYMFYPYQYTTPPGTNAHSALYRFVFVDQSYFTSSIRALLPIFAHVIRQKLPDTKVLCLL